MQRCRQQINQLKEMLKNTIKDIEELQIKRKEISKSSEEAIRKHDDLLIELKSQIEKAEKLFGTLRVLMRNDDVEFMDLFRLQHNQILMNKGFSV